MLEQLKGDRVHSAPWMATCTEAAESTATPLVHEDLGNDAACRVAGAQKQDIVETVGHRGAWGQILYLHPHTVRTA